MPKLGIIYGDQGKIIIKKLLKKYKPFADLKNKNLLIGIKPNLVKASPAEKGATTDPQLVSGLIEYLLENQFNNIEIIESSWVGGNTKNAFKVCGYKKIADKYGIKLIDLKKDDKFTVNANGRQIKICSEIKNIDYLINMPVLKAHCQTKITCSLKNLKGCIPDSEKRDFHTKGLHKSIALLNKIIKTDLIIVDGIYGDLSFEEGGTPVKMDRVIIGKDPVSVDTYAAQLLGYNYEEINHIKLADSFNLGNADIKIEDIKEYNSPSESAAGGTAELPSSKSERLTNNINRNAACSACLGNLIHALYRIKGNNEFTEHIYIGQGYKNKKNKDKKDLGIGSCTRNFKNYLPGCPPSAKEIIDFLNK